MEILRRTQGIDFKAKNSSLMGSVELMLKDADSGKVKEVIKQKNMFTNALDSLFNKSAFNMANSIGITSAVSISGAEFPKQTPVIEKALGGIILFPNTLGDSADLLYPDFDANYPTGYASQAEYTQDDSRQGAFNGNSSGRIPDTNSYKLVYDWGSSFGNGVIASVALSNVNCYKYFNDWSKFVLTPTGSGFFKQFLYNWSVRTIGYNNQGLVYTVNGSSALYLAKFSGRKFMLWHEYNGTPPYEEFEIPDFTFSTDMFICVKNDYIHAFKKSGSDLIYTKIDCSDWTNTSTTFQNIGASLVGAVQYYNTCAVRGNYVYLPKNGYTSLYKINLTNIADITEIEMPSGTSTGYMQAVCGNNIYGANYVIGTDDVVRVGANSSNFLPAYLDGVWCAKIPISSGTHGIYADVITPYCATHADLETAVTKTADKSMTVNYTVTQV